MGESKFIETTQQKEKQRKGNFIGMLDGKIGDDNYKNIKKEKITYFAPKIFKEEYKMLTIGRQPKKESN